MQRWQILSLVLMIVLSVSLGLSVYQSLTASKASGGNSSNNQPDTLLDSASTANGTWLNFTFTWGSESQNIVQGEFRLEVSILFYTYSIVDGGVQERLWMLIENNDDEFSDWDYVGLVFDSNQDGCINIYDEAYGAYASNKTQPAAYVNGFLGFAEMLPIRGPQHVTFAPDKGYTFSINFPDVGYGSWDPLPSLKRGCNNPLHVCFLDDNEGGVFITFLFYIQGE